MSSVLVAGIVWTEDTVLGRGTAAVEAKFLRAKREGLDLTVWTIGWHCLVRMR